MSKKLAIAIAAAACVAGIAGNATAGSSITSLSVQATVAANCSISSTAVNFGAYDPVGANASTDKTGTGTLTVSCTKLTRSEEHTSELQSRPHLVCRLLLV